MREIVKEIFEDHGFWGELKNSSMDNTTVEGLGEIFVNEFDEMYFIIFGTLRGDTLNWLIHICAQEERNDF